MYNKSMQAYIMCGIHLLCPTRTPGKMCTWIVRSLSRIAVYAVAHQEEDLIVQPFVDILRRE